MFYVDESAEEFYKSESWQLPSLKYLREAFEDLKQPDLTVTLSIDLAGPRTLQFHCATKDRHCQVDVPVYIAKRMHGNYVRVSEFTRELLTLLINCPPGAANPVINYVG